MRYAAARRSLWVGRDFNASFGGRFCVFYFLNHSWQIRPCVFSGITFSTEYAHLARCYLLVTTSDLSLVKFFWNANLQRCRWSVRSWCQLSSWVRARTTHRTFGNIVSHRLLLKQEACSRRIHVKPRMLCVFMCTKSFTNTHNCSTWCVCVSLFMAGSWSGPGCLVLPEDRRLSSTPGEQCDKLCRTFM